MMSIIILKEKDVFHIHKVSHCPVFVNGKFDDFISYYNWGVVKDPKTLELLGVNIEHDIEFNDYFFESDRIHQFQFKNYTADLIFYELHVNKFLAKTFGVR